jgi:hypothetical protein
MISISSLSFLIGYFFILTISLYTIIHILKYRNEYGTNLIASLNATSVLTGGILFSSFYVFSVFFHYSNELNTLLWKHSLITYISFLIISTFIYSFFKDYEKLHVLPNIYFTLLFGLLIGDLFRGNSIVFKTKSSIPLEFIISDISLINYEYSSYTIVLVVILLLSISGYLLYRSLSIAFSSSNIDASYPLFLNTVISIIPIMMYLLYVFIGNSIFRELFITLYWIASFAVDVMLIRNPEMFFILPNQIFGINLFHKSGILLYSYKIDKKKARDIDSTIWGSVLIGINHILSEFLDKTDKIDVIQTQRTDIVVKYDVELGFALVINTSRKNSIIENLMDDFLNAFKDRYRPELMDIQDLNRIIDVSDFLDTKNIIEQYFQLYL